MQFPLTKLLTLVMVVLLCACQAMPRPDRATMAMGFAEAAYGLGVEPEGRHSVIRRDQLLRWNGSTAINLVVTGEPAGSPLYQRIVSELQALYQHANLTLKPGFATTNQLLRVTVSDKTLLITDQIKTTCYTRYEHISDKFLNTVHIVATRDGLKQDESNCLMHEGMHSLGFGGHPHRLDSVLSYTNNQIILTDIDLRLIGVLYNHALDDAAALDKALGFA